MRSLAFAASPPPTGRRSTRTKLVWSALASVLVGSPWAGLRHRPGARGCRRGALGRRCDRLVHRRLGRRRIRRRQYRRSAPRHRRTGAGDRRAVRAVGRPRHDDAAAGSRSGREPGSSSRRRWAHRPPACSCRSSAPSILSFKNRNSKEFVGWTTTATRVPHRPFTKKSVDVATGRRHVRQPLLVDRIAIVVVAGHRHRRRATHRPGVQPANPGPWSRCCSASSSPRSPSSPLCGAPILNNMWWVVVVTPVDRVRAGRRRAGRPCQSARTSPSR